MTGIEIAVGYVFAWAVRKAKRVGGRADEEVDRTLDTAMDQLHDLVSRKLGEDPALHKLREEAETGHHEPSDLTRQRVQLALEAAAQDDPDFAESLQQATARIQATTAPASDSGGTVDGNNFFGPTAVQTGNHNRQDNRFGA